MAENTEANRDAKQGMALALAIWIITIVSVAYFFKYGLPDLASTRAAQDTLYYVILVLTGFFYVAVQGFLGLYVWKYRHRDDAEGSYWHDSHKLEMSWTIGTAVILIPVVFAGLLIWQDVKAAPPEGDMLTIEAVAAQFQWDFRYPGPDGEFAAWRPELYSLENYLGVEAGDPAGADDIHMINQLVIPVDQPVRILLRSKDVQHAFFLPNHRVKQDGLVYADGRGRVRNCLCGALRPWALPHASLLECSQRGRLSSLADGTSKPVAFHDGSKNNRADAEGSQSRRFGAGILTTLMTLMAVRRKLA